MRERCGLVCLFNSVLCAGYLVKRVGGPAVSKNIRHKFPPFSTHYLGNGGIFLKESTWRYLLAGAAAGLCNGFFGGGGGCVLVPALTGLCGLEQRRAFATSVAVILPLCALSAGIYLIRGGLDLMTALPYLVGGALGGWAGGRWFRGMKVCWLRRVFGLLLLYGGVRSLL